MVTLRHAPKYERSGPKLEPYQVVLRPLITEKATHLSGPPKDRKSGGEGRGRGAGGGGGRRKKGGGPMGGGERGGGVRKGGGRESGARGAVSKQTRFGGVIVYLPSFVRLLSSASSHPPPLIRLRFLRTCHPTTTATLLNTAII